VRRLAAPGWRQRASTRECHPTSPIGYDEAQRTPAAAFEDDLAVTAAKHESNLLGSIQTLRALAAWLVVGTHFCSTLSSAKPNWIQMAFIDHGSKGVDIFFVISGLVMGLSASAPDLTPRVFAVKRLARIVPAYWFYTVVVALMI